MNGFPGYVASLLVGISETTGAPFRDVDAFRTQTAQAVTTRSGLSLKAADICSGVQRKVSEGPRANTVGFSINYCAKVVARSFKSCQGIFGVGAGVFFLKSWAAGESAQQTWTSQSYANPTDDQMRAMRSPRGRAGYRYPSFHRILQGQT